MEHFNNILIPQKTENMQDPLLLKTKPANIYTGCTYQIYKTIYSNIEVYELYINQDLQVMRRIKDGFLNLSHILKAGNVDRLKRPRIFNELTNKIKDVQFDKVQGGYSKFQGTWIPLDVGIDLAKKFKCYELIKPIIEIDHLKEYPFKLTRKMEKEITRRTRKQRIIRRKQESLTKTTIKIEKTLRKNSNRFSTSNVLMSSFFNNEKGEILRNEAQAKTTENSLKDFDRIEFLKRLITVRADETLEVYNKNLQTINNEGMLSQSLDEDGNNVLHWAMYYSNHLFIKTLLELKPSLINSKNNKGLTPLLIICNSSYAYQKDNIKQVLETILKTEEQNRSITNATDSNKNNILHTLIINKHREDKNKKAMEYYLDKIIEIAKKTNTFKETLIELLQTKNNNNETPCSLATEKYKDQETSQKLEGIKNNIATKKRQELINGFNDYLDALTAEKNVNIE